MNYETVTLNEKTVVGISAITDNNDPACPQIIGGLWGQFMGQGIWEGLQNKANAYCIGLYSDYDFQKMTYTVTIGAEATKAEDPQLTTKIIPAGKYAKFLIKGDVVKDVSHAWEEIWQMPLDRSYAADFEEYISNENGVAEIHIYVALK